MLLSTRKTDPEAVQSSAHASTSQPIAIPAELSSPPPNQPRQLLTPALDSPFGSRQDAPTRASFSAYDSSTSGSDEGSLRGKLELYGRLPPNSAIGGVSRRVASMPLPSPFVSSSPRSPLSGGSFLNVPREELLRRTGAQSVPRHLSPVQPSHLPPLTFGPASHRRRSSASSTPLASFVGSYETSLLTGRMSAPPSLPIQFDSSIGVLGTTDAPRSSLSPAPQHTLRSVVLHWPRWQQGIKSLRRDDRPRSTLPLPHPTSLAVQLVHPRLSTPHSPYS